MKKKIIVILGPTATGKSGLAVELARAFGGEVVSADSRQVYRGLDVGAGKITKREMKSIPHHLLDVVDPRNRKSPRYTVEDFKRDGTKAIADIIRRGKLPIICGGTGFYIDALVYDETFPAVPPDKKLRARLAKKPVESLMRELRRLDPRRARDIDPRNKVRIIRAIEIARTLGFVPKIDPSPGAKRKKLYETLFIGLTTDRETLRERIHARLMKRMRGDTIIRETARLHKKGVSWKRLHEFGLEYRYAALYLQKKLSKTEMLVELENRIVDFSKRQMRWFGANKSIEWFGPTSNRKVEGAVRKFLNKARR